MTTTLQNYLSLALTPGVGPKSFLVLLQHFHAAENVFQASHSELQTFIKKTTTVNNIIQRSGDALAQAALDWQASNSHAHLLTLLDDSYPLSLAQSPAPPPILFARGNLLLLKQPAMAIVGSRHATEPAKKTAHEWAQHLSNTGFTIVSGLADGIDTAAHQGALLGANKTIAILGTGIDRVYPARNLSLAHQIAQEGLLLSEFNLNTPPNAANFPRRNRIIASLSQATIVVEAALESGSLITARLSNEMGKEVFAMPGSIHNPHSKGCHLLIKQGAKLLESVSDIFEELPYLTTKVTTSTRLSCQSDTMTTMMNITNASNVPESQSALELSTLSAMGFDPVHPDELSAILNIDMGILYTHLLQLELDGKIVALAGGKFQRL